MCLYVDAPVCVCVSPCLCVCARVLRVCERVFWSCACAGGGAYFVNVLCVRVGVCVYEVCMVKCIVIRS